MNTKEKIYLELMTLIHSNKYKFSKEDQVLIDKYLKILGYELPVSNTKEEIGIAGYYGQYLIRIEKLVGIELKENTFQKFKYVEKHLREFIAMKHNGEDIPLKYLTCKFLDDFEYYLKTIKKQKQVTINKTFQRLRTPIKHAITEGHLKADPFILYKNRKVRKLVLFLNTEELRRMEMYDFNKPVHQLVQDLFVFCCYTGLPYLEMATLQAENLVCGFDGQLWIEILREKTGKKLTVPLLAKANLLIEKYKDINRETIFPSISNQRFNLYLKEMANEILISKRITHHTARKTFASTVLLYNDVPMEIVSELLGHSSIVITQESYGKVVQKKVSEIMIRLSERLKEH